MVSSFWLELLIPAGESMQRISRRKRVRAIEVLFLVPGGKRRKRQFRKETVAIKYLTGSYATEAPISFKYADGSPVPGNTIDRIYERVFELLSHG